jgi:hypothetical protein
VNVVPSDSAGAAQGAALTAYDNVQSKLARVDFPRLTTDLRTCTGAAAAAAPANASPAAGRG